MRRHSTLRSLALAAAASLIATAGAAAQHDPRIEAPVRDSQIRIPESIRLEHEKKLYTLYAPPNHRDGVVHHTRPEAEADDEHFDGKTTE